MYAYDHTVKKFPISKYKNVHFVKLGIGASNTNEVKTLDTLLRDNGHLHKTINYLKVFIPNIEWFVNLREISKKLLLG